MQRMLRVSALAGALVLRMFNFPGPLVPLSPREAGSAFRAGRALPEQVRRADRLSLLSWNILAPPYKRLGGGARESQRDEWKARVDSQIQAVREYDADVVGLQEFSGGSLVLVVARVCAMIAKVDMGSNASDLRAV